MLGNCEKMVVIPTTTNNEWPQQITDQKISSLSMGSGGRTAAAAGTMEKPSGQDQLQSLKCPRCESTNTKFCYYNNYSLSQPRHFCKSCKRYWTRGGTLRNVPVGGGCRKNKRVRRQTPSSVSDHTPSNSSSSSPPNNNNSNLASHPHVSPLFYGLPCNNNSVNSDMSLVFPRFNSSSVSSYDHLGLGSFSSGLTSNDSLFSNYNSIFGNSMIFGGSSSATAISSLLNTSGSNTTTFQGLLEPVEDHQVKVDEGRHNNQIMEQHGSLLDYYSSTYYWNDQTNNNNVVGPSVTSMIE